MANENGYGYIKENIRRILDDIGEACAACGRDAGDVTLMAVTKTVPPEAVNEAVKCGVTLLGENRVQEYLGKKDIYLPSAEVDFIGGLQTIKVKYIIGSVRLIHSVDSIKLASEIDRLAGAAGLVQDILLEVNIGGELSKHGVPSAGLDALADGISEMKNVRLRGLMTIPPPVDPERYFAEMQDIYSRFKEKNDSADILSMGMSADYALAVRYGSTLVRVGTGIFGARNYDQKH